MIHTVWFDGPAAVPETAPGRGATLTRYAEALAVRRTVFVDEQGFSPHQDADEADGTARHVLVYHDATPIATGRVLRLGGWPGQPLSVTKRDLTAAGPDGQPCPNAPFNPKQGPAAVGPGGLVYPADPRGLRLSRIAVLAPWRGQGIGDLIVRLMLRFGEDIGAVYYYLSAQHDKAGFYARYGFAPCGESFLEEGYLHWPMRVEAGGVALPRACQK